MNKLEFKVGDWIIPNEDGFEYFKYCFTKGEKYKIISLDFGHSYQIELEKHEIVSFHFSWFKTKRELYFTEFNNKLKDVL